MKGRNNQANINLFAATESIFLAENIGLITHNSKFFNTECRIWAFAAKDTI